MPSKRQVLAEAVVDGARHGRRILVDFCRCRTQRPTAAYRKSRPKTCRSGQSATADIEKEREFPEDALWPRRLGPGCSVLVADPLALLRLSLSNAGWRPVPRAWRSAASSLARVPFLVGSLREPRLRGDNYGGRLSDNYDGR